MKAKEFIEHLKKIPYELKSYKIDQSEIEFLVETYSIKEKSKTINIEDPILDFVQNYHAADLEIGMINFDDSIEEINGYTFFGKFEVDDIAVDKNLKEIVMIEEGSDNILYKCASNGSSFLDAILTMTVFLEKRGYDDKLYEDESINNLLASECSELAGDKNKYLDFYKMMLGI